MSEIPEYLWGRLPGGMALADARQLCFRLYCDVAGVPTALQPHCSRAGLADAFAELVRTRWIAGCGKQAGETDFWLDELCSIPKPGSEAIDCGQGQGAARQAEFED